MIWLAEFVSTVQLTKLPFRSKVCLIQKLFLFHFFGLVSKQQASVFHLSIVYLFFSLWVYIFMSISLLAFWTASFSFLSVSRFFSFQFDLRHSVLSLFLPLWWTLSPLSISLSLSLTHFPSVSPSLWLPGSLSLWLHLCLCLCLPLCTVSICLSESCFLGFVMGDSRKNQGTQIQTKTNIFRRYL